jgi:hypothetical protein
MQVAHRAALLAGLCIGRLCPVVRIDEGGSHWLIGVPNWELVDLRVTEGIRLFFTFILQGLKVRQESKEGA